jgi:hypothetical protein
VINGKLLKELKRKLVDGYKSKMLLRKLLVRKLLD